MFLHQLWFSRRGRDQGDINKACCFVFPARAKRKVRGLRVPDPMNPVGHQQFVAGMGAALAGVLGFPKQVARYIQGMCHGGLHLTKLVIYLILNSGSLFSKSIIE